MSNILLGSSSFVDFSYTETRQLRTSSKRSKIVVDSESDIETEVEESFNTTMNSSFLDDSLDSSTATRGSEYWRLRALKAEKLLEEEKRARKEENLAWEAKWQPIEDFLKVEKMATRGTSGQCRGYGKTLQCFLLDAAAEGIAMTDCRKTLISLSRFLPLTNESEDRRVPEIDYFRKIRTGKLPNLLQSQREQWLKSTNKVILTVDATSLGGKSHISIGGFNDELEFLCLDIKQIEGKSALEIASIMHSMVLGIPGLEKKIKCMLTDRARSQEAANKLLCQLLNRCREPGHHVFCICCMMHTVSRIDARSFKALCDKSSRAAEWLMRVFGSRKSMGFRKACLKAKLIEKCQGNPGFESNLGCRFHHNHANGRALVKFEEEILSVLQEHGKDNPNHIGLLNLMESAEWCQIRLELVVPVLIWTTVAGPLHTQISRNLSYGDVKSVFLKAISIVGAVLQSRSSFKKALDMAWEMEQNIEGHTRDALIRVRRYWTELDGNIKLEVSRVTKAAFDQARQKLESDWSVIEDLPIGDEIEMVWNNRRVESTFGFLKSIDRKSF